MQIIDIKVGDVITSLKNDRIMNACLLQMLVEIDGLHMFQNNQHWTIEIDVKPLKDFNDPPKGWEEESFE